ncbi:MAG: TlpA family protein disulfide reductase [Anaerolineae bacterium]
MTISLTDVRSGETFALADFRGRVVVVETMAVWCPLCLDQAREIRQANLRFGDEVAFVSLDVDVNESADLLREHATRNGLDWRWAVAPRELARALADAFGMAILNPPSTPVVILDRAQQPHLLRFGIKPASELIQEIEAYLS